MFQQMSMNRPIISPLFAGLCVAGILVLLTSFVSAGPNTTRIVIDSKALTLKVIQSGRKTLSFSNIAIGRYGTTSNKQRGDHKTPLGHFVIAWITDDTLFHRFFGFRYPNQEYAERAFRAGCLDEKTWNAIRLALSSGNLPPQDTVLGGNLGIHGIGEGDIHIHEQYNWTDGCVALTNDQIDRLSNLIRVGTPVEIR